MRKSTPPLHSEQYRVFREMLLECRRSSGKTQRWLAERLGRPPSFVAKYEAGDRRLDLPEFVNIANALDSDPVALLRKYLRSIEKLAAISNDSKVRP